MTYQQALAVARKTGVQIDGDQLRTKRKLAGHALTDFAALAGISFQYLSLIERGDRAGVSPPVFARICDALGIAEQDREQLVRSAVASCTETPVEWLTVQQAAHRTQHHPQTIYAALRDHEGSGGRRGLRGYRPSGRWRIDAADVDVWVKSATSTVRRLGRAS